MAVSAPLEIPENFTPGPWKVGPTSDEPGLPEIAIVTPAGTCPAVAIPLGKATAANARLIALAPQMASEITALRAECQRLALGEAEAMALVLSHEGHIDAQAAELTALRAEVERLTASLAAAEAEAGRWQPIEMFSGRDGEVVLTAHHDDLFPICAFRINGEWLRMTEGPEDEHGPGKWEPLFRAPTHWMPAPFLPALSDPAS